MSAVMIAMLCTREHGDRWGLQLSVFALATGWFLVRALDSGHRPGRAGPPRGTRLGLLHQAVAMAAMFWMILSMSHPAGPASPAGMRMSMPGMAAGHVDPLSAPALPATTTTLVLAGYLAVATVWWVGRHRAAGERDAVRDRRATGRLRCAVVGAVGLGYRRGVGVGGGRLSSGTG
jgi:hypothetical protein